MKKKYEVRLRGTCTQTVVVQAESVDEAIDNALSGRRMLYEGEVDFGEMEVSSRSDVWEIKK